MVFGYNSLSLLSSFKAFCERPCFLSGKLKILKKENCRSIVYKLNYASLFSRHFGEAKLGRVLAVVSHPFSPILCVSPSRRHFPLLLWVHRCAEQRPFLHKSLTSIQLWLELTPFKRIAHTLVLSCLNPSTIKTIWFLRVWARRKVIFVSAIVKLPTTLTRPWIDNAETVSQC